MVMTLDAHVPSGPLADWIRADDCFALEAPVPGLPERVFRLG